MALSQIDGRGLDVDGQYGPATAAAVLAYKQKRMIINNSYQDDAGNIVGRMTIARLDSELCDLEGASEPVVIHVLQPRMRPRGNPYAGGLVKVASRMLAMLIKTAPASG